MSGLPYDPESAARVLAGPDPRSGMEGLSDHVARIGPLPPGGAGLIDVLERSTLRGRGGAAFPVGTKWRSIAERRGKGAVVLVNGAEGEPLSHKDRMLMQCRPHLVVDGAFLAARSVGAREVVVYVGEDHPAATQSMRRAIAERTDAPCRVRLVPAPARYVAGEETAAVHCVNEGVALPTSIPPRPFERGVDGHPTLVQNVESLAHAALIARFGDRWFLEGGRDGCAGTVLLTVYGAAGASVVEVPQGTTIADAVVAAGGPVGTASAVLVGGYFGGWIDAPDAWTQPVDAMRLRLKGSSLGCGVIALLPPEECGVTVTARIARYLADGSAQQCGPCAFGLRAIAEALERVAASRAEAHEVQRLRRWATEVRGRGACRHPDGASGLVLSALDVFDEEITNHAVHRRCSVAQTTEAARWTS